MSHEEKLNLSSLKSATQSFKIVLDIYAKEKENDIVRDSCIQRFEYCYELSTKMLRRHLANIADNPSEIKEYAFQKLIREGFTKGVLLHSWDVWSAYRNNRNRTSHGYDKNEAIRIAEEIPSFLVEVEYLLEKLEDFYEN